MEELGKIIATAEVCFFQNPLRYSNPVIIFTQLKITIANE